MSVRNELETLLSISQGTAEDYGDYILRVLEEVNAVEDSIFNTMTKGTQDWVNDGILAYNGNQPIPEFPIIQRKVGTERLYKHIVEPEISVDEPIKAETITIPDVVSLPEIETEIQENIGNIEESIPDIVSLPEIETEIQESINTELALHEQELDLSTLPMPIFVSSEEEFLSEVANLKVIYEGAIEMLKEAEELTNEEFRKQEDELFSGSDELFKKQEYTNPYIDSIDLVKKKRGRPKGTKNKEDKLLNKLPVVEPEFTENEPFHFEIGTSDTPVKKKRGRPKGTMNRPKDVKEYDVEESGHFTSTTVEKSSVQDIQPIAELSKEAIGEQIIKDNFPPSEYEYKLVSESMDMETGEVTPEFELTKIVPDISAHRRVTAPDGSLIWISKTTLTEPSKEESTAPFEDVEIDTDIIEEIPNNLRKYGLEDSDTTTIEDAVENIPTIIKPQKPLDLFRILVCQNYNKPFEEIFKLAENQSIDIKKPTALVTCSTIKATINTLKNLGMLKEEICR